MKKILIILASVFFHYAYILSLSNLRSLGYWLILIFPLMLTINFVIIFILSNKNITLQTYFYIIAVNFLILSFYFIRGYGFRFTDVFWFFCSQFLIIAVTYLFMFLIPSLFFANKNLYSIIFKIFISFVFFVICLKFVISYLPIFHTQFYPNGDKKIVMMIDENGHPYGKYEKWKNGKILIESGKYENGYEVGIWKEYDLEGNVINISNKDSLTNKVQYIYK